MKCVYFLGQKSLFDIWVQKSVGFSCGIVIFRAGGCDDGLHLWKEKGDWSCSLVGTPALTHFLIFVLPNFLFGLLGEDTYFLSES